MEEMQKEDGVIESFDDLVDSIVQEDGAWTVTVAPDFDSVEYNQFWDRYDARVVRSIYGDVTYAFGTRFEAIKFIVALEEEFGADFMAS